MPLLAVSSATSLTENSVRVTYDAAVQFSGTWEPGDAGDPKNYEITAAGLTYEVSSVAAVEGSTTSVDLFLREVLPADGTLTVTGVRSASGDELGGSNTATIRALPYRQPALVDAVAGGVRDIANVNGVWFIDRGGDFTTDVGLVQLRKRLFRRLSTPKNAISHLPGYGVNVAAYIKQLASASARTRLIADIEQQFSQEPEVLSTSATLMQFGNRGLWRLRVLVRTRFGTTLRPEYDVGVLGNEPWTSLELPKDIAPTGLAPAQFAGIQKTSTAGFGQRDGAQLRYLDGFYYLIGGWDAALPNGWSVSDVTTNEVWRSPDLVTWTKILAHDPSPPIGGPGARFRRRHTFGAPEVPGYLYVIGGDTSDTGPPYPSDVWRSAAGASCGTVWDRVAATSPWGYLSIIGYFQGAIHIMGGTGAPRQHVRSVDGGVTWETLPDLPFSRASVTRAVVDTAKNRMYIVGGIDPDTGLRKNDCWEYTGLGWRQTSSSAAWTGREWHATAVYESRLWSLTGSNIANYGGARYSEDSGATWTELPVVPWGPSHADGIVVTPDGIALASGNGHASKAYLLKKLPYDPTVYTATLPWTLWVEGWCLDPNVPKVLSKASAGSSASHSMTIVSGGPTQGEVNGRPTIVFDGINDVLRYTGPGDALDLVSRTAYTLVFTGKITSSPTDSATTYANPGIACESTAYFGINVRSSGVVEAYHDGGSATHADVAWSAGQIIRIQVRFDGATLQIRKNGGSWTSVAKGAITPLALGPFAVGSRYDLSQFLSFELCEMLVSNVAVSVSDLDIVESEQKAKWGT